MFIWIALALISLFGLLEGLFRFPVSPPPDCLPWFHWEHLRKHKDFSAGPVVKTLPARWGGGQIPGQRAKISLALWPKNQNIKQKQYCRGFPGGSVRNPPTSAGDPGLIPDPGRSHGAAKPRSHNSWARVPQPLKPQRPRAGARQEEKALQWEAHGPQWRVAPTDRNFRKVMQHPKTSAAKNKF